MVREIEVCESPVKYLGGVVAGDSGFNSGIKIADGDIPAVYGDPRAKPALIEADAPVEAGAASPVFLVLTVFSVGARAQIRPAIVEPVSVRVIDEKSAWIKDRAMKENVPFATVDDLAAARVGDIAAPQMSAPVVMADSAKVALVDGGKKALSERQQHDTWRRVGEAARGVVNKLVERRAHLAGRPGNEEADRHPEAQRREPKRVAHQVSLTPRERDVLRVLARDGGSNKAIARELDIAPGTVKVLLKIVFSKLRLHNRTAAAVWYRKRQDVGHLPHHVRENFGRAPNGVSDDARDHQQAYRTCQVF